MIHFVAERVAAGFVSRRLIEKADDDIYVYAFEIILSTAANICVSLIISLLFHQLIEGILFTAVFVAFRRFVGGHHAQSHLACILTYAAIFTVAMALIAFVPHECYMVGSVILCLVSCPLIYAMAPIEHKNKPISAQLTKKLRKRGRVFVSAVGTACILGVVFAESAVSFTVSIATASVCASMVYAFFQKSLMRERCK
jgi:accessory gene regulator B